MIELNLDYGTVGQWSKIELPCYLKNVWLLSLVGSWAAFEGTLCPDRMCDGRAEIGLWHSGSVVRDLGVMLFENFLSGDWWAVGLLLKAPSIQIDCVMVGQR